MLEGARSLADHEARVQKQSHAAANRMPVAGRNHWQRLIAKAAAALRELEQPAGKRVK